MSFTTTEEVFCKQCCDKSGQLHPALATIIRHTQVRFLPSELVMINRSLDGCDFKLAWVKLTALLEGNPSFSLCGGKSKA